MTDNITGLTLQELNFELQRGAKLVRFYYTISIVILTFRRTSRIYLIRHGESASLKGLPWTLVSLLFGWWGIPWGPIWTVQSLFVNLRGGKDVSAAVRNALQAPAAAKAASASAK